MSTTNTHKPRFPVHEADHPAADLGELCELLDHLRGEVAVLDAIGLHDVADQMESYGRLVRRVVYAAIRDLGDAA